MWECVVGDEISLVRRRLFLLGDLIKYWRTQPREICQKFSNLSQWFLSFLSPPWPNYCMFLSLLYFIMLLLLLFYYYACLTAFCTAFRYLCLLGNVSLTLHTHTSSPLNSRLLAWHLNHMIDLQESTLM